MKRDIDRDATCVTENSMKNMKSGPREEQTTFREKGASNIRSKDASGKTLEQNSMDTDWNVNQASQLNQDHLITKEKKPNFETIQNASIITTNDIQMKTVKTLQNRINRYRKQLEDLKRKGCVDEARMKHINTCICEIKTEIMQRKTTINNTFGIENQTHEKMIDGSEQEKVSCNKGGKIEPIHSNKSIKQTNYDRGISFEEFVNNQTQSTKRTNRDLDNAGERIKTLKERVEDILSTVDDIFLDKSPKKAKLKQPRHNADTASDVDICSSHLQSPTWLEHESEKMNSEKETQPMSGLHGELTALSETHGTFGSYNSDHNSQPLSRNEPLAIPIAKPLMGVDFKSAQVVTSTSELPKQVLNQNSCSQIKMQTAAITSDVVSDDQIINTAQKVLASTKSGNTAIQTEDQEFKERRKTKTVNTENNHERQEDKVPRLANSNESNSKNETGTSNHENTMHPKHTLPTAESIASDIRKNNPNSTRNAKSPQDSVTICHLDLVGKCDKVTCMKYHNEQKLPYVWQIHLYGVWLTMPQSEDIERMFCCLHNKSNRLSLKIRRRMSTENAYVTVLFHPEIKAYVENDAAETSETKARRLSTVSYSSHVSSGTDSYITQWRWYWAGYNNEWQLFQPDEMQHTLEAKYLAGQKEYLFFRDNFRRAYNITFSKSMYLNLITKQRSQIMRRPLLVRSDDVKVKIFTQSLEPLPVISSPPPIDWVPLDHASEFELVEISHNTLLYAEVSAKFDDAKFNIGSIYRVQNHQLWTDFCRKEKAMTTKLHGASVDKRQLFYGTDGINSFNDICIQNFDPMLSGKNGAAYGQGIQFETDAVRSHMRTSGQVRYMFLANVLVGKFTKGDPSYRRPPEKPGSVYDSFDSCVNRIKCPSIFVVFEKCQCYPEFLVQYKDIVKSASQAAQVTSQVQAAGEQTIAPVVKDRPLPKLAECLPIQKPQNTSLDISQLGTPVLRQPTITGPSPTESNETATSIKPLPKTSQIQSHPMNTSQTRGSSHRSRSLSPQLPVSEESTDLSERGSPEDEQGCPICLLCCRIQ